MLENKWEIDHKLWLNDIKQWEKQHLLVRTAINELVEKLRTYDVVLDYHRHQIIDHKELMDLHNEAMSWNEKNTGKHKGHEISDILELEEEGHRKEAGIHQRLRALHEEVLRVSTNAVMQIGQLL